MYLVSGISKVGGFFEEEADFKKRAKTFTHLGKPVDVFCVLDKSPRNRAYCPHASSNHVFRNPT